MRDLAWVIGSPPLMHPAGGPPNMQIITRKWSTDQLNQHKGWLSELDSDPTPLLDSISQQKRFRLGRYFEELVLFWIKSSPHFKHIANQVQIIESGRTLGEADLILNRKGIDEHWELAVKYYLCSNQKMEWSSWVGPNAADNLDKKMTTLLTRQLRLFENANARKILTELGIEQVVPCLFLKGYFFNEFMSGKVLMPDQSASPLNGWWCKSEAFADMISTSDRWVILDKEWWLAPVVLRNNELPIYSAEEALEVVRLQNSQNHAVQCAPLESTNAGEVERFRLFVVPSSWPNSQMKH